METDPVLLSMEQGIATIILNKPEIRNAFDDTMIKLLTKYLQTLEQDHHVKAVVLRGQGEHFSAGADMNWMRRMAQYTQAENHRDALALAGLMHTLNHFPKPTIAVVKGSVFGGAIGLVACCDIALGTPSALFCFSEVKIGLVPAVVGPYVLHAIGQRNARRYMLTSETIPAENAYKIGLMHEVVEERELENKLQVLLNKILDNGPKAVIEAKKMIHQLSLPMQSELPIMEYTAELIANLRVSEEGQEGLTAFLEKRKPKWKIPPTPPFEKGGIYE